MFRLPKPYISYSAVSCFNKTSTHRDWIKKYIYKEPFYETPELLFGRRVSDNLEKDNLFEIDEDILKVILKVKMMSEGLPETNLVLQQKGFWITSYLDRCTEDYTHFTEYKTGKVEWTKERVSQHKQLDFYSWIIYANFGILPKCSLIWMETEKVEGVVRFTGKVERFDRKVTKKEIKEVSEWTHESVKKMEQVYNLFLDGHDLLTSAKDARELIKTL